MGSRWFFCTQLSLLALWNVCSLRSPSHAELRDKDEVLNLLDALNSTSAVPGVSKVKGRDPGSWAWRFRARTPHLTLPPEICSHFLGAANGHSLGLYLIGQQAQDTEATLVSLTNQGRHLLRLTSNTGSDWLRLEYGTGQGDVASVLLPGGSPFSVGAWARMALGLERERLLLFVECRDALELQLPGLELRLTAHTHITFSSTYGDIHSKFTGNWQVAQISHRAHKERPWRCYNNNVALSDSVMEDQPGGGATEALPTDPAHRLSSLERQLDSLSTMLAQLKEQNIDLQARVQYLESCECVRRVCVWEGREMEVGSRWMIDGWTVCTCSSGQVQCSASNVTECSFKGKIYSNDEAFQPDPCSSCVCENGRIECKEIRCPALSCDDRFVPRGECCPICRPGCEYEGELYGNGAVFVSGSNPCLRCTCTGSQVRCESLPCPPTSCAKPYKRPGECCPVCSVCDLDGRPYNGSFSTIDGCQTCTCKSGDVMCTDVQRCSQTCHHGVKLPFGSCCRDCSRCDLQGHIVLDGVSFPDLRDPCRHCMCNEGNVECTSVPCAALDCSLLETVGGECCPRCRSCVQKGVRHLHGSEWKHPENPCSLCTCLEGRVSCHREKCSSPCKNPPSPRPGTCCPVCDGCGVNGVDFLNGERVPSADRCEECVCVDGDVLCSLSCPPAPCPHPFKSPGECCPRCEQCHFESQVFLNGQSFTPSRDPCLLCHCLAGSVECNRVQCSTLSCLNPHKPSGQCCPQCADCEYENRVFVDGEAFLSPVNPCAECVCNRGNVACRDQGCPRAECSYPLPGPCCQSNCNGCSYAGKDYPNGAEFPHPTDKCRTCHCTNGNVQCLMKRCPPLQCSSPDMIPGECCPQCPVPPADCEYEEQIYRHAQHFYHPTDSCQSCSCTNGTASCRRKPCPPALCSHPIQQDCCRTCNGCVYDGTEHANGAVFADVSDPCGTCVCRQGSVTCERRRCPSVTCPFPVQGECCQTCQGCRYAGVEYLSEQEFEDPEDHCSQCVCVSGHVTCNPKPCYTPDCTHPLLPPGRCCPECDGCSYGNRILLNGQTIPDSSDACSECTCRGGSVQCVRKVCSAVRCPYPVSGPCGCPVCEGCLFQGRTYIDGETFPSPKATCEECKCNKGEVHCTPKLCSRVACRHPALDPCGCEVCDGCRFHGRKCVSGERFPDPEDPCQSCTCLNGGVSCVAVVCVAVACVRPVRPVGECCPVCTGVCEHLGRRHDNGTTFTPTADPCSTCTCLNEEVSCKRRSCPVQCTHPARSRGCCPVCEACVYEGVKYRHTQTFPSPSDPCQHCMCDRGSVTCSSVTCPLTSCSNPVTPPGQCCPECRVCVQHGKEFAEGQTWRSPTDPCMQCHCEAGEVHCVGPECEELSCMHQLTDPASCCPRCRGCVYEGVQHAEGGSWFAVGVGAGPCVACVCADGVTTCSELQCLSPCSNHISIPGECCPVCADCIYDNQVYGPGESFHPSDDPCQICTCEVMPDGEQHLRCVRRQCPRLVNCPKHSILPPGAGACCPTCAQPLSNCTATLIGNEVLATDDPCYTCQCKDLTWTCVHQGCPTLSCPSSQQYTPPESCCPVCDECVLEGGSRHVPNGGSWTDSEDECITCNCNLGHVECKIEECSPLPCQEGLEKMKSPGKCCYECQEPGLQCVYESLLYGSGEQWQLDECTSCSCVSGDVHCHTQRCPAVTCAADETPAQVPGVCCARCLPRPASCVVFGDPHYRTFDGHMISFQGSCSYVLAQDCHGGDFSVHVTNDDRGRKGVSWTKEVTVFLADLHVKLLQNWVVMVDDQTVSLPFLREPHIYLTRKTNTIILNTNIGLTVQWNGRSHLEVSVPATYKKHTCGLCGNFNNFPQDDLRLRSGQISPSVAAFGNDWKVKDGNSSSGCADGVNINPCKEAGYFARKAANVRCAVLKAGAFKSCHKVLPPERFFAACVYDLCACGANTDECVCDSLEAYASECRKAGVVLQWRSASLCAVGCPTERGYVFDECGPPCAKTCVNQGVPLGVVEARCLRPCVPGCQCPAGLVEHEAHCISPDACPRIIHNTLKPH